MVVPATQGPRARRRARALCRRRGRRAPRHPAARRATAAAIEHARLSDVKGAVTVSVRVLCSNKGVRFYVVRSRGASKLGGPPREGAVVAAPASTRCEVGRSQTYRSKALPAAGVDRGLVARHDVHAAGIIRTSHQRREPAAAPISMSIASRRRVQGANVVWSTPQRRRWPSASTHIPGRRGHSIPTRFRTRARRSRSARPRHTPTHGRHIRNSDN